MALGAVQTIVKAGITPSYATPGSSENIIGVPNKDIFLHVKNANASSLTVTLVDPYTTPGGNAAQNPTVSVPGTTGDKMILLPLTMFQGGAITVNFSITASVTAAVLSL